MNIPFILEYYLLILFLKNAEYYNIPNLWNLSNNSK